MAVEFLDEAAAQPAGVEWLDAPASGGVEFIGEGAPADPKDVTRRMLDPNYQPTLAEFKIYDQAQANRAVGQRAQDFGNTAAGAFSGLVDTVAATGKGVWEMAQDPEKYDPLLTGVEAVARGTARDLELAKKLLPSEMLGRGTLNFDQFAAVKRSQLRDASLNGQALTPENFPAHQAAGDVTPELLSQWRKEYDEQFVPKSRYEAFMAKRAAGLAEMQRGNRSVITGEEAAIHPAVAEGVSLVASPMALVPFGKAMTPAKTLTRAAAAKTLAGAGKTFEWVGEKTVQAATLPERAAGAAARMLSGSDEAGAAATQTVAQGVAGISMAPVKAAGKTISAVGEAAGAAGRQAAAGPSRYGLFDRIAKDSQAPQWLRIAANAARPADGALSLAGSAVKGAAEGGGIGMVLGAAAEGEEGAAAGLGAGLALGAGGGLAGRILGAGRYNEGLKASDLAAWIASKSPQEVLNIRNLNLTRDQALNLADTERLAKGVGQDVEFRYITDKEFSDLFGIGKGAQVLQGDRPVLFINTGYKGARSVFHEVMHALDALDGFAPQRVALNRILFDQTLPDGQLVSKGIYSAADLGEFTSQYRERLNQAAKAEFDLMTPEDRQARIMSEVRSESFANLMNNGGANILGSRGIKRRVADALLLADHQSMLGRMRGALESVGVQFNASGEPSELFVRNGKPITNTPAVDAALRDYIRAKDQITRKLVAGEEGDTPSLVVRPQDLLSRGNAGLIDTFRDHDIFARNPDGSVKMLGGVPVLLSEREIRLVQTKRVEAMISALKQVPNRGATDTVTEKPNGAWEGRTFSDEQLAAFDALPDDILSPSMKAKLRELNALARSDGQQIILDYNAALSGGKYSSGIAPTTRAVVPLTFNISKAGNFYMTTLDTTHFFRKLGAWQKGKPRAFASWNGDMDAFLRDAFTYLDNHVNGRPGAVNLDADPAMAIHKKNVINDFFNVPKGAGNEDLNPVQLSGRGSKDNLIRSRRFDRINRVTPGAGDKFPIRYELQKANFLLQPGQQPKLLPAGKVPKEQQADLVWRVGTRAPTAVGSVERGHTHDTIVDMKSLEAAPELRAKLATLVRNHYPQAKGGADPLQALVEHGADNLIWLYEQIPAAMRKAGLVEDVRARSKLWYDGARKLATTWENRFKVPRQGVAGSIAALSPQRDWFMNLSLAERVLELTTNTPNGGRMTEDQHSVLTYWIIRSKEKFGDKAMSDATRAVLEANLIALRNKPFAELDLWQKAVWIRSFSQAHHSPNYNVWTPEGVRMGLSVKDDGNPQETSWGSFSQIGNAISIIENPSKENISRALGDEHKVRNFYNNILLPQVARFGDVTIDTHAVGALLLKPVSGKSLEVSHNFGTGGGSDVIGSSGLYPVFADSYRLAAQRLKMLPRELQSITWEAVRGLFTDQWKKNETNGKLVKRLWAEYSQGERSLNETRKRITDLAGGIRPPEWTRPDYSAHGPQRSAINAGQFSGAELFGAGGGDHRGRRGGFPTIDAEAVVRPASPGDPSVSLRPFHLAKFLPAGVSPVAVHNHLRAQAQFDLAQKAGGPPNLNNWLAASYVAALDNQLNHRSKQPRTTQLQRVKAVADRTSPQDMAAALDALMSQGREGATKHLEQMAASKVLLP